MCEKCNGNYNIDDYVLVWVNVKNESLLGFFLKLVGYMVLLKLN